MCPVQQYFGRDDEARKVRVAERKAVEEPAATTELDGWIELIDIDIEIDLRGLEEPAGDRPS